MADIEFVENAGGAESYSDDSHGADSAVVDAEVAAPHAELCKSCGCPVETADRFCPACGTAVPEARPNSSPAKSAASPASTRSDSTGGVQETSARSDTEPAAAHKYFRCQNCGAEVATDPDQRSYVCPFCDSTYVAEFTRDLTGRQAPEFVIGFGVTPDEAREKFRQWIRHNGFFRPGDLASSAIEEKQKGVYLPFWSFSMRAQSQWDASIGEYWWRTETYTTTDSKGRTVTRTRRVRETEWYPLSGRHHRYYSGYLVSGSRGLPQADAERIKPFQLPALKRYEPYYLAGWLCEEYSVAKEEALQVCHEEFYRREQSNVAHFLPGDTHRNLDVRTHFDKVNSDLCVLPIYILSYRYRDKLYRFLVNGQTGKVAGDKPLSWKRIGAFAGTILLIVAIVALVAWWNSR